MMNFFEDAMTKFSPKNVNCVDRGICQGHGKKFEDPVQKVTIHTNMHY